MKIGSRRQVWNGTAERTGYGSKGLKKSDLLVKKGRIKSRRACKSAKKNKNLGKYIDMARKNKGKGFLAMRKNMTSKNSKGSKSSKHRKKRTSKRRKTSKKGCRNNKGRYKTC